MNESFDAKWYSALAVAHMSIARSVGVMLVGALAIAILDAADIRIALGANALILFGAIPLAIASALPTRLAIRPDCLFVVNGLARRRFAPEDVAGLEWRRVFVYGFQPTLAVVDVKGKSTLIVASMTLKSGVRRARVRQLVEWCKAHGRDVDGVVVGRRYMRDWLLTFTIGSGVVAWSLLGRLLGAREAVPLAGLVAVAMYPIASRVSRKMSVSDQDLVS